MVLSDRVNAAALCGAERGSEAQTEVHGRHGELLAKSPRVYACVLCMCRHMHAHVHTKKNIKTQTCAQKQVYALYVAQCKLGDGRVFLG